MQEVELSMHSARDVETIDEGVQLVRNTLSTRNIRSWTGIQNHLYRFDTSATTPSDPRAGASNFNQNVITLTTDTVAVSRY